MSVHIFGIRHHGPGSARSVREALGLLQPDLILVEGPPEGNGMIPLALHPEMQPPVALLLYPEAQLRYASYFPFAIFSPEWNAIQFGAKNGILVRFMDLPQRYRTAMQILAAQADQSRLVEPPPAEKEPSPIDAPEGEPDIAADPLFWLAKAAGYTDGERWWDQMVEHRRGQGNPITDVFAAILEAMTALRESVTERRDLVTDLREAYMRKLIRAARREGYQRIAVVCGAWHAPALRKMPSQKHDDTLLRSLDQLPPLKMRSAWIPWTHGRLTRERYSAGVRAPGWYHYLWTANEDVAPGWIAHTARLLREHDLDASPAQIIDTVRLAETLAALRDRPVPSLQELNEASLAALCMGSDGPLRLIYKQLIIGEIMGKVPLDAPAPPLKVDLERLQAELELVPEPSARRLELDLREERDAARSRLLHRLNVLKIGWGALLSTKTALNPTGEIAPAKPALQPWPIRQPRQSKPRSGDEGIAIKDRVGTAFEVWRLQWQPEFALNLIEMSAWGSTLEDAAINFAHEMANHAESLPALTLLLDHILMADLPSVIGPLLARMDVLVALSRNLSHLMDVVPPLARIGRYGVVRNLPEGAIAHITERVMLSVCLMLPVLSKQLADEPAAALLKQIVHVHASLATLDSPHLLAMWYGALGTMHSDASVHPTLRGRACRLLHEGGQLARDAMLTALSLALSPSVEPSHAALWLEGYLLGSGLWLIYDTELWSVVHHWLRGLREDIFKDSLPKLRRTFSGYTRAERRRIGEQVRQLVQPAAVPVEAEFNTERADKTNALLAQLLGT